MMQSEERMLVIEGISPEFEQKLGDAIEGFESGGIQCSFHYRAPQPQASLDWIVPTAIGIWFLDKYFGSMVSEAAKDHRKVLAPALQKLYEKTLGAKKTLTRTVWQMAGTVRRDKVFSGNLSFMYRAEEGWRVKLLFPLDVSASDYERSCVEFAALLRQARQEPNASPLIAEVQNSVSAMTKLLPIALRSAQLASSVSLLLFWDETKGGFRVVDPATSSRTGDLVSWPLGTTR